jgi:dihydrofolate synthase / folylpolyglutamate synthase
MNDGNSRNTETSSTLSATDWVAALSPWPRDGFGTERMRALLAELGDPQLRYPAVHVVGTNGKSTTTRMTETLLADAGLAVGAYLSPHIRSWSERIRIGGKEADFEEAVARVRPHAGDATQFEILTAAALLAFAEAEVDVAVVEAGLGGRHDATNVLRTSVVVLTNVALDHMDVLGDTREAIAAEKLAVVQPGTTVVLGDPEWEQLARENGAARVVVAGSSNLALATAAAEAFLGRDVDPHAAQDVSLPGRLERRGEHPLEIWDGAHNLAGVGYLLPRLPEREYVVCCSILADKRPELMLEALSVLGGTLVATESPNERSLEAGDLAARAEPYFSHVEPIADPHAARSRAVALAGPSGAVVVTGSLYLLSELSGSSTHP